MTAYLVNIALMFIWAYWLFFDKNKKMFKNPERTFCILMAIQWILMSGLRGLSVGADTRDYKLYSFDAVRRMTWSSLGRNFVDIIFRGADGKDPGYLILEKVFQLFSKNYQVWLIFIAVVFTVPMAVWVYKNSKNVFMSFLIYSCLFYAFFAITGHRQTIATGLVVFCGEYFIKRRKLIPFLIIVLLMSTIHKSCLIFTVYYFLYNKKITKKYVLMIVLAMIVGFIFKEEMLRFLAESSGYEGYDVYEGAGTYTFTALMLMITAMSLWRMKTILAKYPEAIHSYNALMIALVFIPITFVNPSAMRVVQYFSVYIMLIIPYIIKSFDAKNQRVALIVSIATILLLFIRGNPQYVFFWETV